MTSGAIRLRNADRPAARVTINSEVRDSRTNIMIVANSTIRGMKILIGSLLVQSLLDAQFAFTHYLLFCSNFVVTTTEATRVLSATLGLMPSLVASFAAFPILWSLGELSISSWLCFRHAP